MTANAWSFVPLVVFAIQLTLLAGIFFATWWVVIACFPNQRSSQREEDVVNWDSFIFLSSWFCLLATFLQSLVL